MRKNLKRIMGVLLSAALVVSSMTAGIGSVAVKAEGGTAEPFRELDSYTLIAEMGTGWNLGNTMDGCDYNAQVPGETQWQKVKTTKEIIKTVHDLGFNTLRVPVTWMSMINDEDYSINEEWISRVQEIVDYGISQGMYVILNIHHDGADQLSWLNISEKDEAKLDAMYKKFEGTWKTIATRFKDYDEHLIFESMNEIWETYDMNADQVNAELAKINKLNQIFVDAVRSTGSNNATRWLLVPGRCTQIPTVLEDQYNFVLPEDTTEENRLMVSVHDYDAFGLATFAKKYEALYKKYVRNGIPVVLGEYGWKTDAGTEAKRAYCYEGMNRFAKKYGIIAVAWDDNGGYQLVDRVGLKAEYKNVVDALMRGFYNEGELEDIERDYPAYKVPVTVRPITSFDVSTSEVTVGVNKKKIVKVSNKLPEDTNDLVLWKTADDTIATVSDGRIYGKGVGTTTVTAFTQSGDVAKEVTVTVTADSTEPDDAEEPFKAPEVSEDPTPTPTVAPTQKPATPTQKPATPTQKPVVTDSSLAKGTVFTAGSLKYQVTGKTAVAVKAPKSKKAKTVTIPATVKKSGVAYKVTSVGANAFKNCKKLKKVTIGKNVTSIGKNAFSKSKALKTIVVKSAKIKSVGKNAFKGINKKAVIKVPKAKLKKYQKLFKKKGQAKSVKIKK